MSQKTKCIAVMEGRAKRTGHGFEAREKNMRAARTFTKTMFALAMPFTGPEDIERAHLLAFVIKRTLDGIGARTQHNDLAAIRGILKVSGRVDFANSAELKSRALGVPKGNRKGTNRAITPAEYEDLLQRAKVVDEGVYCMFQLEFTLGLRGKEALMSWKSLPLWETQLMAGKAVFVHPGTKNHRPRYVHAVDALAALAAVLGAMSLCAKRDGKLIPGTLKQALARYTYLIGPTRLAVKGHSLRYAYAKYRYLAYRSQKFSIREALALVSQDLGHGDRRGLWLRTVYLRGVARIAPKRPTKKTKTSRTRKQSSARKAARKAA
jgi:hypothetical protein